MTQIEKELRKLVKDLEQNRLECERLKQLLPQLQGQKASLIASGNFEDEDSLKQLTAVDAKARLLPPKISQLEGREQFIEGQMSPLCERFTREALDLIDPVVQKAFLKLKAAISSLVADPSGDRINGGTNLGAATSALWPFSHYAKVLGPLQQDVRMSGEPAVKASHILEWCERCEKARKQFSDLF